MVVILTEREVLQRFTRGLVHRLGGRLRRLVLYGSRARGEARPASDYDLLAVVSAGGAGTKSVVAELAEEFALRNLADLSVRVLPEPEYEGLRVSGIAFWKEVARDEVTLWPPTS